MVPVKVIVLSAGTGEFGRGCVPVVGRKRSGRLSWLGPQEGGRSADTVKAKMVEKGPFLFTSSSSLRLISWPSLPYLPPPVRPKRCRAAPKSAPTTSNADFVLTRVFGCINLRNCPER